MSLSKATKANDAMKVELQALRKKVNDQKSEMDELYESHDDLEQYTQELIGNPRRPRKFVHFHGRCGHQVG